MSRKRVVTLLLSIMLTLTVTGCGNETSKENLSEENKTNTQSGVASVEQSETEEELYYNKEGYPICDEPITLTIALPDDGGNITADSSRIQLEEYASRLGIQLELMPYSSENFATQLNLMLANDDLPDIVVKSGWTGAEVADYGEQGYLLDLSQYMDLMPNFQETLENNPDYKAINTTETGAIYGLTQLIYSADDNPRVFLDKAWMDRLGLKVPTTVDELYEVLKAFKEQDANGNGDPNDEIPMQYTYVRDFTDKLLYTAFGMNPSEFSVPVDVDENGQVRLAFMSENYKAFLQYMNKLYTEELIDPEAFSATDDIIVQKYKDDLIGCGAEWAPYVTMGVTNDTDVDVAYYVGPLTSDYCSEPTTRRGVVTTDSNKIMISAACEYPEAVCRFIDYLFTYEGSMSATYGYEGLSFEYVEVPGLGLSYEYLMPEGYTESSQMFKIKEVILNTSLDIATIYAFSDCPMPAYYDALLNAATKYHAGEMDEADYEHLRRIEGYNTLIVDAIALTNPKRVSAYPALAYSKEEGETVQQVKGAISAYLQDAKAQFIIGGLNFEDDWDNYINTLNAMGAQDLLAAEQSAYERFSK